MKFKKKTLANGLRIITVPMLDNPTVTVLVLVAAGSDYETQKNNGISHFLEHMCFKGTENRPTSLNISVELDSLGTEYNAFTDHEWTGYYAKSAAKHFGTLLDVVSDIYLNPTFPKEEIEREKGVIIEEINMYDDMPARKTHELFDEILYADQPAGMGIAGPRQNIRNATRDDFVSYKSARYVASNTIIVVAGQIDEAQVISEVNKKFKDISTAATPKKKKTTSIQKAPAVLIENKKTDQTHFILGVRTYPVSHPDSIVLSVISGIMGQGMSSRLFQRMREELGICYYVRASNDTATDHGDFRISNGVDTTRIDEALIAILAECTRLKNELVSEAELSKVKEYIIGTQKLYLEASDDVAQYCGLQELIKNEIDKPEEKAAKLRKVTAEDIRRVARKVFIDKNLNLALIGPFEMKDQTRFQKLLSFK